MGTIDIDKGKFLQIGLNAFTEKELFSDDYFYKMNKDGLYIDVVKRLTTSYNLQKVEQRCIRAVLF